MAREVRCFCFKPTQSTTLPQALAKAEEPKRKLALAEEALLQAGLFLAKQMEN